jgi:hypothetical protein
MLMNKTPSRRRPAARARFRLAEVAQRSHTQDIGDWLAVIASWRSVGITTEGTLTQYRRDGIVFRPLRDAPPVAVQLIWRRHDPHPPRTRPSPC